MRGVVAKRLRRQAEKATAGKPEKDLFVGIRRFFKRDDKGEVVKDAAGMPLTYDLAGTARHKEGTTRKVYQNLKKAYRQGEGRF